MEKGSKAGRIGGIVVLLLAAALLLLGYRMGVEAEEGSGQAAAATPAAVATAVSTPTAGDAITVPLDVNQETVPVLSDNALAPAPVPVTFEGKRPHHDFQTYTVERGDTPSGIAFEYGIKTETLLGGNPFLSQESSLMQPGMVLTILPLDGVSA